MGVKQIFVAAVCGPGSQSRAFSHGNLHPWPSQSGEFTGEPSGKYPLTKTLIGATYRRDSIIDYNFYRLSIDPGRVPVTAACEA